MTGNDRKNDLPIIQWYPGHMKKARELVEENLKLVDVVVELLDARIPAASANPMLREIIGDKPRVVALNKKDLADEKMTKRGLEHFRDEKLPAVALDSVTGKGMREVSHGEAGIEGRCGAQGACDGSRHTERGQVLLDQSLGRSGEGEDGG